MSDTPRLAEIPVPTARVLADAILAAREAATVQPGPTSTPAARVGCTPDELHATVTTLLVRYSEVMARLADA